MDFDPRILHRFFSGKYSRKDSLAIKDFLGKTENDDERKELMQNHWFDFQNEILPEGNIDQVLERIHHQIQREGRPEITMRFIVTFQRFAAILIIPLVLTFLTLLYFQSKRTVSDTTIAEIQCPLGVRTKFVLPDGTTGFLNSGSTLTYPAIFTHNRNVVLNGEAFFDVAHDEKHPFFVKTPHLSTKVLGTQFNVIAYDSENTEEVILKNGKVEVYTEQGDKLEALLPNQNLVLDIQTGQHHKRDVEALQYVLWTEGKLVFRNENMQQVASRLGRWYNVEIEIEDAELLKYSFRATFIDEPLEEVLKLLAKTAPLIYEEQKRKTTGNNVLMKRKIVLSLDRKREYAF